MRGGEGFDPSTRRVNRLDEGLKRLIRLHGRQIVCEYIQYNGYAGCFVAGRDGSYSAMRT